MAFDPSDLDLWNVLDELNGIAPVVVDASSGKTLWCGKGFTIDGPLFKSEELDSLAKSSSVIEFTRGYKTGVLGEQYFHVMARPAGDGGQQILALVSDVTLSKQQERLHQSLDSIRGLYYTLVDTPRGYETSLLRILLPVMRASCAFVFHRITGDRPHQVRISSVNAIEKVDAQKVVQGIFKSGRDLSPFVDTFEFEGRNHFLLSVPFGNEESVHFCFASEVFSPSDTFMRGVTEICDLLRNQYSECYHLQQLQKLKERLELALGARQMGVWDFNVLTNELVWDQRMFDLYEIHPSEFSGNYSDWKLMLSPEDRIRSEQSFGVALETGQDFHERFEIVTGKGNKKIIQAHAVVVRDDNLQVVRASGLNWDVTEEVYKETETEQRRMQHAHESKLASLGELAAGVGHEIAGPLTVATACVYRMKKMSKDSSLYGEDFHDMLSKLNFAVERITKISGQLRKVARRDSDSESRDMDLAEEVEATLSFIEELYKGQGVKILRGSFVTGELCNGVSGQLQQVLMNILGNAKDAMVDQDVKEISVRIEVRGDQIVVVITDNGPGVPDDLRNRIFEKYFTTKEQGTGIGLAICREMMNSMGGDIKLNGRNCFEVSLPKVSRSEQRNRGVGELKLLIVDDDSELVDLLAGIVSEKGAQTYKATSIQGALSVFRDHPDIHAVLSDLNIEGDRSGIKLLEEIEQISSHRVYKCLITGGFVSGGALDASELSIVDATVYKPFSDNDILEVLSSISDHLDAS